MNKTKRALISMIVISTVFCITLLFNIQLPFIIADGNKATATDAVMTGSDAVVETANEPVIHSFSVNQAKIFSVDQYLSSGGSLLAQEAGTDNSTTSETNNKTNEISVMSAAVTQPSPAADEAASDNVNTLAATSQASGTESAVPTDGSSQTSGDSAIADSSSQPSAETAGVGSAQTSVDNAAVTSEPDETIKEKSVSKYSDIGISVAKDYVNIRKEPSTDSGSLGKLYRDSACTIISKEDGWYYVESGDVTGYAKADYIKNGLSDEELISKYSTLNISVAVDGLNVRKEPTEDSKKLTVIYQNEKYPVLEQNGDWIKIHIEDENLDGYVKSEFADLIATFKDAVSKEEEAKILQLQAEERAKKETEVKYGDGFTYTEEDLKLLACLVHAEAGTQSYEGKLAVANIVLNRVKSSKYPDTIKSVIYQDGQFSVAHSGSLEKQLNNFDNYNSKSQKMSIKAAKDALEGMNNIGKRLYFHTYKAAAKKGYNDYESSVKLGDHLFW
jgi:uncharacterized protein YgiM (DUF1202 family)